MIQEIIGTLVLVCGGVFLLLGSFGILRFPDVYNRLQAGTKCTTLGAFLALLGVGILNPAWLLKCLLIAGFILLTNPVSSHALGRASCKAKVLLWPKSVVDKSKEFPLCHNKERN